MWSIIRKVSNPSISTACSCASTPLRISQLSFRRGLANFFFRGQRVEELLLNYISVQQSETSSELLAHMGAMISVSGSSFQWTTNVTLAGFVLDASQPLIFPGRRRHCSSTFRSRFRHQRLLWPRRHAWCAAWASTKLANPCPLAARLRRVTRRTRSTWVPVSCSLQVSFD